MEKYYIGFFVLTIFLLGYCQYENAEYGSIWPEYLIAYTNMDVIITCISFGNKTWFKNGKELLYQTDIKIVNIQENDMGVYTCQGSLPNGKIFYNTSTILVGDKEDEHISPNLLHANIGERAKFECKQGTDIQWHYEKNNALPESSAITTGAILYINSVKYSDAGVYYCYGKYFMYNKHFLAKSSLIVYDPNIVDRTYIKVQEGDISRFMCTSEGQVYWQKEGQLLVLSAVPELKFNPTNVSDEGYYICSAKNHVGKDVKSRVYLEVEGGMVPFPPQHRQKYGFTDDAVIVDSLMDAEPRYFQGKTCHSLTIKNGAVVLQNNHKLTAIHRCSAGFKLNGPIQRQCHNGEWSGKAPTCESASSFSLLHKYNTLIHDVILCIIIIH